MFSHFYQINVVLGLLFFIWPYVSTWFSGALKVDVSNVSCSFMLGAGNTHRHLKSDVKVISPLPLTLYFRLARIEYAAFWQFQIHLWNIFFLTRSTFWFKSFCITECWRHRFGCKIWFFNFKVETWQTKRQWFCSITWSTSSQIHCLCKELCLSQVIQCHIYLLTLV